LTEIILYGVKVCIDRDPNTNVYYLSFEYKGDKEPPLPLGEILQPDDILDRVEGYLIEKHIQHSPNYVKRMIAQLLRNAIRESGVEDWKTIDAKIVKWIRKQRK
jgi:hypothetical protein